MRISTIPELLFSLLIFLLINFSAFPESYNRGETIMIPAPIGVDSEVLGIGYRNQISEANSERVFSTEFRRISENIYRSSFVLQQNIFQRDATLKAFNFVGFNTSELHQKRFALLTVYSISEVARIESDFSKSVSNIDFYASAIYYGWALNVLIDGSVTDFTKSIAANLESFNQIGGSIKRKIESYNLRTDIFLRGLQAKSSSPEIVLDWNDVKNHFDIGEPQPIFIEYTFLKSYNTDQITWSEQNIIPGDYRLIEVGAEIAKSKSNGRNWDFSGPPDPFVDVYINGELVLKDGPSKNNFSPKFQPSRTITITRDMILQFDFIDKDLSEHDEIGRAQIQYNEIINGSLNKPIELVVTGQVKRAWIILGPIK